ncbi:hypothetical protein Btru_057155 [Bulinus truncatus]|nr:hypothetical protein Btru_057155 [Bulinus truncatus]
MGIMSKSNRLPERPKPPSWDAVTEDISSIMSLGINDDVVFDIGKINIVLDSIESNALSEKNKDLQDSDLDASDSLHSQEIESSYNDVLRLIALYSELKEAPVRLEQHCSHLKHMGYELTQSILNLKELAQSVSKDAHNAKLSLQSEKAPDSSTSNTIQLLPDDSASMRKKPKQKKKK